MSKNKTPLKAWLLSFIVPGLGLLYLGQEKKALANFVIVNAVLLASVIAFPTMEYIHYMFLAMAAMSAGYAHSVARSQQTGDPSKKSDKSAEARDQSVHA